MEQIQGTRKHLFLTGEIQVGKSTVIQRWLAAHPGLRVGGFRTVPGRRGRDGADTVHIVPAVSECPLTRENCVLMRRGRRPYMKITSCNEVFDQLGVALLQNAAGCSVILMDEIGIQEELAFQFHAAVLERLDGDTPVLGVVRSKPGTLTDAVRAHPNVEVVTVTEENRNEIFRELMAWNR